MDSFFGVGLPEFALIIILATIVLGPQRMRALARQLGRWTAQLQAMTKAFTEQLNNELDEVEKEELRGAKEDIQQLRQQYADLRKEILNIARQTDTEVKNSINPGLDALRQASQPPAAGGETPDGQNGSAADSEDEFPIPTPLDVPEDPES